MNRIQLPCTQKEYEEIIVWVQQKMKEEKDGTKQKIKTDVKATTEKHKEVFNNTLGKRVRITYVPYKFIDDINHPYFYKTTSGIIENITCSNIYIINDNGCFEILRLKQILEMVQIED